MSTTGERAIIEPTSIKRIDPEQDPASFESLRKAGVGHVQELSGLLWTDYNVHDPGVTILEQLCFRLAELAYRSDFPVNDILADRDGVVDLHRQGLIEAHEILPSRPTTLNDLRALLLSEIVELDAAWLDADDNGVVSVRIGVRTEHANDSDRIAAKVRKICLRNRNLCEDFRYAIEIVPRKSCTLHASIEVEPDSDLPRILGELYFQISRYVAGELRYGTYGEELATGRSVVDVYSGPLLKHGHVLEDSVADAAAPIQISKMSSLVKEIDGVLRIEQLYLQKDGEDYSQTLPRFDDVGYMSLTLPTNLDRHLDVRLTSNGRSHSVSTRDIVDRIEQLRFADYAARRSPASYETRTDEHSGQFRDLEKYTSVLELLPEIYGTGKYGAASVATREQKARLSQLKAYLSLFDQRMADFSANLGHVRDVFSIDSDITGTYFSNPIGNDVIDDIASLYDEPSGKYLDGLTRKADDFSDRRNRVLDYLLSLYGESFPQEELRGCAYYDSSEHFESGIIEQKLEFLRKIVEMTRDRGAAFDYSEKCWNTLNVSGLQARLTRLLNFRRLDERSLVRPLLDEKLRLVGHSDYLRLPEGRAEETDIRVDDGYKAVPDSLDPDEEAAIKWRNRARELRVFRGELISDALLRRGTQIRNYRVGRSETAGEFRVVLQPEEHDRWWLLGSAASLEDAQMLALAIKSLLVELSEQCEGMHLVEHLLLRPSQPDGDECEDTVNRGSEFTKARFTVVLPDWTRRSQDPSFRLLAEQLIAENAPAHLSPNILWLDFLEMYRFEALYMSWLKEKRAKPEGSDVLDEIASEFALFIDSRGQFGDGRPGYRRYV